MGSPEIIYTGRHQWQPLYQQLLELNQKGRLDASQVTLKLKDGEYVFTSQDAKGLLHTLEYMDSQDGKEDNHISEEFALRKQFTSTTIAALPVKCEYHKASQFKKLEEFLKGKKKLIKVGEVGQEVKNPTASLIFSLEAFYNGWKPESLAALEKAVDKSHYPFVFVFDIGGGSTASTNFINNPNEATVLDIPGPIYFAANLAASPQLSDTKIERTAIWRHEGFHVKLFDFLQKKYGSMVSEQSGKKIADIKKSYALMTKYLNSKLSKPNDISQQVWNGLIVRPEQYTQQWIEEALIRGYHFKKSPNEVKNMTKEHFKIMPAELEKTDLRNYPLDRIAIYTALAEYMGLKKEAGRILEVFKKKVPPQYFALLQELVKGYKLIMSVLAIDVEFDKFKA